MADKKHLFHYYSEIDRISQSFGLHMHRDYDLSPNPEYSIAKGYTIQNGAFYGPTPEVVQEYFPGQNYRVELAEPDVRGVDPFFYKVLPSPTPI